MTMMLVRALLVLCILSPLTFAASIQWTGIYYIKISHVSRHLQYNLGAAGNSLWNFATNWYVLLHNSSIFMFSLPSSIFSVISFVIVSIIVFRLGGAVPTASDDVIINALGGATVQISQSAAANSVTIAGGYSFSHSLLFFADRSYRQYEQSLILLSSLTVGTGGITVAIGGTLQVCAPPPPSCIPPLCSLQLILNTGAK
jgi:hypothetical protein